jgi:hypothetical protein
MQFFVDILNCLADSVIMDITDYKYFKYEMALGTALPMPAPKLDTFPESQYSVQQFLHMVCKEHVGALGKREGKWCFGDEVEPKVNLGSRSDITLILDFAEQLGVIVRKPSDDGGPSGEGGFTPYQLSQAYWERFDKFAS